MKCCSHIVLVVFTVIFYIAEGCFSSIFHQCQCFLLCSFIYFYIYILKLSIPQGPACASLPEPQFSLPANVRLHVYESVELELSLLPDDQGFTTPLHLHPDPLTPTR